MSEIVLRICDWSHRNDGRRTPSTAGTETFKKQVQTSDITTHYQLGRYRGARANVGNRDGCISSQILIFNSAFLRCSSLSEGADNAAIKPLS